MVNDERPATFQIPGRGRFEDHKKYHDMLLREFHHTLERALEIDALSPVRHVRIEAAKNIRRRIKFHYLTAVRQLPPTQAHMFEVMFKDRV